MLKSLPFKLLFLCLFFSFQAEASKLQFVMPDYYLGVVVSAILKVASQIGYNQYDPVKDPQAQQKAQAALDSIYANAAFNYTFDKIKIKVIRGRPYEPNGFAFGSNIFITKSLIDLLNEEELTAVIAHELAHSEKAHNMQKAPLPLEATIYQLKNIFKAVQEKRWPRSKDLLASIREIIETGGLAMELQADCIAAQQLDFMNRRGLKNEPMDIVRATNKILGYDLLNGGFSLLQSFQKEIFSLMHHCKSNMTNAIFEKKFAQYLGNDAYIRIEIKGKK